MRQREQRMNQQLKEQGEWENENKRLKQLIDTRTKEVEDWKVRNSRL
jgi:cell shape-determining protein MreC